MVIFIFNTLKKRVLLVFTPLVAFFLFGLTTSFKSSPEDVAQGTILLRSANGQQFQDSNPQGNGMVCTPLELKAIQPSDFGFPESHNAGSLSATEQDISAKWGLPAGSVLVSVSGASTHNKNSFHVYDSKPTEFKFSGTVPVKVVAGHSPHIPALGRDGIIGLPGDVYNQTTIVPLGLLAANEDANYYIENTTVADIDKKNRFFWHSESTVTQISFYTTEAKQRSGIGLSLIPMICVIMDDDGDGVPNDQEEEDGTDPSDSCDFILEHQTLSPSDEWMILDCDGDGVTNEIEMIEGTDPLNPCDYNPESVTEIRSQAWEELDCDGDGNPNGSDPNPLVATARDDDGLTPALTETSINILANDDFLPNNDSINRGSTQLFHIDGTAMGSIQLDAATGMLSYTPLVSESNTTVTIVYEVCNRKVDPTVCATATVRILVEANILDAQEDAINGGTLGGIPADANVLDNDTLNGNPVLPKEVILTATPTEALSINEDGSIELTPGTKEGSYSIDYIICEVSNTINCDSATVTVLVSNDDSIEPIEVNQLVTPNGDGKNDFLFIRGVVNAKNNSLQIYNRWGVSVYEGRDYNNQNNVFEGRSRGRSTVSGQDYLPAGIYYYIFQYQTDQEDVTDSGYLYLSQ